MQAVELGGVMNDVEGGRREGGRARRAASVAACSAGLCSEASAPPSCLWGGGGSIDHACMAGE